MPLPRPVEVVGPVEFVYRSSAGCIASIRESEPPAKGGDRARPSSVDDPDCRRHVVRLVIQASLMKDLTAARGPSVAVRVTRRRSVAPGTGRLPAGWAF